MAMGKDERGLRAAVCLSTPRAWLGRPDIPFYERLNDIDVLRQMVQFMAQRLMELDVEARCGAGYDEENPERINSRNGYRERAWDIRLGAPASCVQRLRALRGKICLISCS